MNDQISRQKLIEELNFFVDNRFMKSTFEEEKAYVESIKDILEIIKHQPPADQWIPCSDNAEEYIDTGCEAKIINTVGKIKVPEHLKFTKDGEVVKEFVLCKNTVGEIGYYERVMDKFYAISEEPYKGAE